MHADEKYVVFKREDINHILDETLNEGSLRGFALEDAVVIRTQDVFAHAGIDAYLNVLVTHRNLCFAAEVLSAEELEDLDTAITYFKEVAQEAQDRFNRGDVKLPD